MFFIVTYILYNGQIASYLLSKVIDPQSNLWNSLGIHKFTFIKEKQIVSLFCLYVCSVFNWLTDEEVEKGIGGCDDDPWCDLWRLPLPTTGPYYEADIIRRRDGVLKGLNTEEVIDISEAESGSVTVRTHTSGRSSGIVPGVTGPIIPPSRSVPGYSMA